jgi:hypothetical protein
MGRCDPDVTSRLEEEFFRAARARYGERRWSDAHAAGRRMSFHEAIALAVEA